MAFNYLKKYYLEDEKLAQRARLEFSRALSTGRMIAFTGSMATQAHGYGSWIQLKTTFAALSLQTLKSLEKGVVGADFKPNESWSPKNFPELKEAARKIRGFLGAKLDGPVAMSLIEEVLDQEHIRKLEVLENWPHYDKGGDYDPQFWPLDQNETPVEAHGVALARWFRSPEAKWRIDRNLGNGVRVFENYDVPGRLWGKLGIRRFATVTYDLELEKVAMLSDKDSRPVSGHPDELKYSPFSQLRELRKAGDDETFSWDLGSGRIRRVMQDGWALESDLLNRERIDRMIEFAVGTDDVDSHIIHLHGRCDNWRSMIVSQRDYDALYRRNDLNRAPFEQARRMMMGGNPILFVGLGMTEADLNRELSEFVSNNPYQRAAPTFLLWNAGRDGMDVSARKAKRLDLLHRLGVLTIFDTDLGFTLDRSISDREKLVGDLALSRTKKWQRLKYRDQRGNEESTVESKIAKGLDSSSDYRNEFNDIDMAFYEPDLRELAGAVALLADAVNPDSPLNPAKRENHVGMHWRSTKTLISRFWNARKQKPAVLWNTEFQGDEDIAPPETLKKLRQVIRDNPAICIIGPQGCGKGRVARWISKDIENNASSGYGLAQAKRCLLINGGFSFDTDSLLDAVATFLDLCFRSGKQGLFREADGKPKHSRSAFFESLNFARRRWLALFPKKAKAMIIINGMERFFGIDGRPLSSELDGLIRTLVSQMREMKAEPKARFVFFGTERVRAHMEKLGVKPVDFYDVVTSHHLNSGLDVPGYYLNSLNKSCNLKASADRSFLEEKEAYLANASGQISGDSIELRRAVFNLLFSSGTFRAALGDDNLDNEAKARQILRMLAFVGTPAEAGVLKRLLQDKFDQTILEKLCALSLVLEVGGFQDYSPSGASPPPRYVLHRSLLTELRYRFGIPLNEAKLSTAFNMSLYVAQPIDGDIPDCDIHNELGSAIDRLIGGYKNADHLWDGLEDNEKDALQTPLEAASEACADCKSGKDRHKRMHALCHPEQVQCLRAALALSRSYYSTTGLLTLDRGDRLLREDHDGILHEHGERLDDLIDAYGKITLARESLRQGEKRLEPEIFNLIYGAAEPFYADELVWLHNERGVVRLAMGDLYEAKASFDRAMKVNREWVEMSDRAHNWRRIRLNQLTVEMEMGELGVAERKIEEIIRESSNGIGDKRKPKDTHEDKLAWAIAIGYRGWCFHLRGQVDRARVHYNDAIRHFGKLNELRGQAYFSRLRVSALDRKVSAAERLPEIELALDLAQSSRQMDIVHRLQITLADEYLFGRDPKPDRQLRANRLLEEAVSYALQTDVHRVRCEASAMIAQARYKSGDYDGALRYAMDAMMIASRYGMELRKIVMRAVIAKIMVARGHPVTAEHLARTCIKMATRQRYQTAIDKAEQVLIEIPQMSPAMTLSDRSGLRRF